jgi:hypothetical protein
MRLGRSVAVLLAAVLVLQACAPRREAVREEVPSPHAGHAAASAPPPQPLRAGESFVELSLRKAFKPAPARGTDEYRCFLVDPGLKEKAYLTGSQFLPGNAAIVHHAIFFRVPPAQVAEARGLDDDADGDGWTCFGGTGIAGDSALSQAGGAGSEWIGAWAPGGAELLLAEDIGYELAAGTQIIMQIHYNTLSVKDAVDRSGMRLRIKTGEAKLEPLRTLLVPAPVELPCAPGESGRLCDRDQAVADVTERFGPQAAQMVSGLNLWCSRGRPKPGPVQSCAIPVRESGVIHAAAGHMHLLGRSIKVELNAGTSRAKVILDVPAYNFDDQRAVPLPEPVAVKKGDSLKVTCTHDAELRRMVSALKTVEPRYVVWGEGTSDEMCLAVVNWTRS